MARRLLPDVQVLGLEEPVIIAPVEVAISSNSRRREPHVWKPHPNGPICYNCGKRGHIAINPNPDVLHVAKLVINLSIVPS